VAIEYRHINVLMQLEYYQTTKIQWWATVTFKVTTLPLPLLRKKERSYRYNYFKKSSEQLCTSNYHYFYKKRFNDFFSVGSS